MSIASWILSLVFISVSSFAAQFRAEVPLPRGVLSKKIELKIDKGTLVHVLSYDTETETYNLRILSGMDIGPNLITLKELERVSNIRLMKGENPQKLIGKKTLLSKKAKLVTGIELNLHRKQFSAIPK